MYQNTLTYNYTKKIPVFLERSVSNKSFCLPPIKIGQTRRPIRLALISSFCSMKRLGVFLLP